MRAAARASQLRDELCGHIVVDTMVYLHIVIRPRLYRHGTTVKRELSQSLVLRGSTEEPQAHRCFLQSASYPRGI
jgi:hypothetical protein